MDTTSELTATQAAAGRARLYTLLAQIAAGPVTPNLTAYLRAVETLHAAWGQSPLAAKPSAHYEAILGYQVLPYAGYFLHAHGMLGGPVSEALNALYQAAGFAGTLHSGGSDHLANILDALAHLAAAESDAWEDDHAPLVRQIQYMQGQLLQRFLLPWLPPLVQSLVQTEDAFYTAYGNLLAAACADHWETLPDAPDIDAPDVDEVGAVQAEPPALPDLTSGGIREVAAFLCLPASAGIYLLRGDLQRLGRAFGIAPGFGGRGRQLQTLFQTIPLHELPRLLNQLTAYANQWRTGYSALAHERPTLRPWIVPWTQRTQSTLALLQRMTVQADEA